MKWLPYLLAAAASAPWLGCVVTGQHPEGLPTALMTGVAILGSAFLLSWACEVAEEDVPQALAVSVLALVAVLPEYAVDATFAWKAAHDPTHAEYAIANMTGGNRLMLGLGWSLVGILTYFRTGRREVVLPKDMGAEVAILLFSTLYALVPVYRGSLNLFDTAVYLTFYVMYLIAAARGEEHESEAVGPAAALAVQPAAIRRAAVLGLLVFAAGMIFLSAEPFAESLVLTGKHLGVDEFVLVQWVAPIASEAPEMVVATLMVWRGASATGLRALISSSVNQWTLLVGTLALVYSISAGHSAALPLDTRQQAEVLLTAAQCLFGIAVLADLSLALWQGALLVGLFILQPIFSSAHVYIGGGYIVLFVAILALDRHSRRGLVASLGTFRDLLLNRPRASHD